MMIKKCEREYSAVAIEEPLELQETIYSSKNLTHRWLHQTRRDRIEQKLRSLADAERSLEIGPGSGIYLPLVAEFCGQPGLCLLRWLEGILRDAPLSGLLRTQYYVLRKRPSGPVQA